MSQQLLHIVEDDVRRSALALEDAADRMHAFKIAEHLEKIVAAMPGSGSAMRATSLEARWHDEVRAWVHQVHVHKDRMLEAAKHVTEADLRQAMHGGAQEPRA